MSKKTIIMMISSFCNHYKHICLIHSPFSSLNNYQFYHIKSLKSSDPFETEHDNLVKMLTCQNNGKTESNQELKRKNRNKYVRKNGSHSRMIYFLIPGYVEILT